MEFKQATYKRINKKITMKCNGYTQKDKNRICVYFHYYNNDNKPFYIGQGTIDRAFRFGKTTRNYRWWSIVKDISLVKVIIKHIDVSIEESIELEHKYIVNYKPYANISEGIGNTNINKYDNKNCKGVVKLDLNGNFISDYISAKEAAKSVNGYGTDITKCCRNKRKQYKGYKWIYFEDYYSDIKPNHN